MTCHRLCQVFSLFSLLTHAWATDLGTFGTTFEIDEKDIREVLTEKLHAEEGQKLLHAMLENLKTHGQHPPFKGPDTLSNALENNSFLVDPSVTLTTDFKDPQGVVFYHAGTPLNPLMHMTLSKGYVFIDGDDLNHRAFAQQINTVKPMMIIVVKGDPLKMMKEKVGVTVFFDQEGFMCKRFKITKIPATVEQEGMMLRVTEHTLKEPS